MRINSVNRSLDDKAFDRIDHALARPVDPMAKTYREYFATDKDGEQAAAFRASPHWIEGRNDGRMAWFFVTQEGRAALRDHLKEIGDKNLLFIVTYEGHEMPTVATSHSKARYSRWLDISDCREGLTFREFQSDARVRLAAQ